MKVVNTQHQPVLSVKRVSVRLQGLPSLLGRKVPAHWALKDVTFQVRKGEVLGVIGRNGAGKSSLLRVLARIISPDDGVFLSYGCKTYLLGLQTGFLPELTGRENAVLSGMLMGCSRARMKTVLPEIQNFSELGQWFDRPIAQYSAGMLARLGFSVALYADADIVLIDEVLGVGDLSFKDKSSAALENFLRREGRSTVLVSHSASSLEKLCDRVLWLEGGGVVMVGEPKMVLDAYARFVQEYERFMAQLETASSAASLALAEVIGPEPRANRHLGF